MSDDNRSDATHADAPTPNSGLDDAAPRPAEVPDAEAPPTEVRPAETSPGSAENDAPAALPDASEKQASEKQASEKQEPGADANSAAAAEAARSEPAQSQQAAGEGDPPAAPEREPRFKIGSQRKPDEKHRPRGSRDREEGPKAVVIPPPPKPNKRRTPFELEQEIDATIGDFSMDAVMTGESIATAGKLLEPESRVQGRVVEMDHEFVYFDLGGKNQGAVKSLQFAEDLPELGETREVIVNRYNAAEGIYEASIPGGAIEVADWSDITDGMVVEARVTGHNTGGLECEVRNIRGFIPASQVSLFRAENLEEYVGQKLNCVITEANPGRGNLVLSHRALLEREREEAREKLFAEIEVGQTLEGTVTRIQPFGAFVDLGGGVDGLIHISKLGWERVKDPSEVVSEGEKVKVRVEKVDHESRKIGLSLRDLLPNPWDDIHQKYPADAVVRGTVSRTMPFGAFVKLEPGVEGLIHISEIAHHRVAQVQNHLTQGQEVEAKVLSVDPETQRIGLSLKALSGPAPERKKSADERLAEDETPRELAVRPTGGQLKGGRDSDSGGGQFGLKW